MLTSLTTPSENRHAGGDQARALRSLVARQTMPTREPAVKGCHTIVVSGGKGGVGRSVIALNLAITLAQRGEAVGLLDASPDYGNIALLCGMNGYWNLSHVAQGSRQLDEVLAQGPAGVSILSGANCLNDPSQISTRTFDELLNFERNLDWLIVDGSGGASSSTREFAIAADDLLIVTTPESTAIADAYASVKSLAASARPRLGLLVNQAESANQAQRILDRLQQTTHALLHIDLHRRGFIPRDVAIPKSVNSLRPFVLESPMSAATSALQMLTQRWTRHQRLDGNSHFFARIQKRETTSLK